MASLQGSLDRLKEVVGSLRGEVHQIDSQIDGLTDRMTSMESRIMGQLDSHSTMLQDLFSQLHHFHPFSPPQCDCVCLYVGKLDGVLSYTPSPLLFANVKGGEV